MPLGERHGRAVLTQKEVDFIRENYRPGNKGGRGHEDFFSLRWLAKRFHRVSHRQIFRIIHGENWREG